MTLEEALASAIEELIGEGFETLTFNIYKEQANCIVGALKKQIPQKPTKSDLR